MMNPAIFHRMPLSSADSTNAARNESVRRFGQYPPPTSGQRSSVIANRIESHNSAAIWIPLAQQRTLCVMPPSNTPEPSDDTESGSPDETLEE